MKTLLKTLVAAAIAASSLTSHAIIAEGGVLSETVNGYTWNYRLTADGKGAELYFNGVDAAVEPELQGVVAIPAKLGGKPVVAIGAGALSAQQNVTEITIPSTVTRIEAYAFLDCYIEHLTLPTGLKYIGNDAFSGNAMLRSVVIPDNVTEIGGWAFNGNEKLEYVQIGKKVDAIGDNAFRNCKELKNIVFKGNAPPQIAAERDTVFENVPVDCALYVPKSAKGWPTDWKGFSVIRDECKVPVETEVVSLYGGKGSVSGGGEYAIGKKVALKAKAESGSVFAGWYMDELFWEGSEEWRTFMGWAQSYSGYTVNGVYVKFIGKFATVDKDTSTFKINDCNVTTDPDGTLDLPLFDREKPYIVSLSEPKLTFKNLPAGIKYDVKAFKLAGKATKPGVYKVAVSATNASVKKAVTAEWTITVPNFTDDEIPIEDRYEWLVPGVNTGIVMDNEASGCSVTGLPPGLKWTAKDIEDKALGPISACTVYGAATKPGNYTVYFTKTVGNVKHTATTTFVVPPFPKLTIETEGASGKDKVTGGGEYAAGKKVSLKATPDTGKDNPKVFIGWYDESYNLLSQSATYSYEMPSVDTVLRAVFITQEEDSDGISVGIASSSVPGFDENLESVVFLPCGVNVDWPIVVDALSQTTVKVSGLPAGMKYTAKEVIDPKTKDVIACANSIYGAPTAESKTKLEMGMTRKVPSLVKIEVTTSGKTKKTYVVKTYVEAMQPWAVGTFNGGKVAKDGDVYDLASMTVASTGKISGKVASEDGYSYAFSAASFAEYDADKSEYSALIDWKDYREWVTITKKGDYLGEVKFTGSNPPDVLYTSPWKSDPWKTLAKKFTTAAAKTLVLDVKDREGNPGTLTLQFDASGAVKAKGVFTVEGKPYTASCSSVVTPTADISDPADEFDAYLYVLLPYKSGKFEGYGARLNLHWNGTAFELRLQ